MRTLMGTANEALVEVDKEMCRSAVSTNTVVGEAQRVLSFDEVNMVIDYRGLQTHKVPFAKHQWCWIGNGRRKLGSSCGRS